MTGAEPATARRPAAPPASRTGGAAARPEIAIFNVKFSPNLGDGLLSECLEAEVRAACPGATVYSLDLAGRQAYGEGGGLRRLKLTALEMLPRAVRQIAAGIVLRRLAAGTLIPSWRRRLASADAVVIGGGNLFADADLNFPIKLATALGEAGRRRLPIAVFGVGVTPNWSARGSRLFGDALAGARLSLALVRDERSRMAWNDLLDPGRIPRAAITSDPGLLAARHFPVARRRKGAEPVIALGITDPVALRYHGGAGSGRMLSDWLAGLVRALAARPCRIRLFTNGSPEDRRFLDQIGAELIALAPDRVSIVPPPGRPIDLAHMIAGCDLVMAHRMHACIAAYAYGVPTVGFVWDMKLRSFFELTERARYILDPVTVSPDEAATIAFAAIVEGISPALHDRLVERCRRDVAAMVETLLAAPAPADDRKVPASA